MTSALKPPPLSLCVRGPFSNLEYSLISTISTLEDGIGGWPSQETDSRGASLISSPENPLATRASPPGTGLELSVRLETSAYPQALVTAFSG